MNQYSMRSWLMPRLLCNYPPAKALKLKYPKPSMLVFQSSQAAQAVYPSKSKMVNLATLSTQATTVANHLYNLWTDEGLYKKMSDYAKSHVPDEVGTVGNAAAWLYLAAMYSRGERIKRGSTTC